MSTSVTSAMSDIDITLADRGEMYGSFVKHADITQSIKGIMQEARSWNGMEPDQKEALEMIANKIGRIINGDPNYYDSWQDIAGYAELVNKRLKGGIKL